MITDEMVEAAARASAETTSRAWGKYTEATKRLIVEFDMPIVRAALEAVEPLIRQQARQETAEAIAAAVKARTVIVWFEGGFDGLAVDRPDLLLADIDRIAREYGKGDPK